MIDERYFTPGELTAKLDSHYNSGAYLSGVKKYEVALREYRKLFEHCEDLENEIGKLECEIFESATSEVKKQYERRIKAVKDELNDANTALATKKRALQNVLLERDSLKSDVSFLVKEKNDLEFKLDKMKLLAAAIEEFYPSLSIEGREHFNEILKKAGYGVSVKEIFTVFELRD